MGAPGAQRDVGALPQRTSVVEVTPPNDDRALGRRVQAGSVADDQFDERYMSLLEAAGEHWWVQGMRSIASALVGEMSEPIDILDAGCGTGALLPWAAALSAPRPPTGVDFSPAAVDRCRAQSLPGVLAVASVTHLPFADERFDLVLSSDVLQHLTIEQAADATREMARVMRRGGRALVRTNASFGHGIEERRDWRLYRPETLRSTLESAGLLVERLTAVNLLQGLWASMPRRAQPSHSSDRDRALVDVHREVHGLGIPEPIGHVKNRLLRALLQMEARYLRGPGRALPYGHSLYAVARRS